MSKDKLETTVLAAEMADVAVAIVSYRHIDDVIIDSHKDVCCWMLFEWTLINNLCRFAGSARIAFNRRRRTCNLHFS